MRDQARALKKVRGPDPPAPLLSDAYDGSAIRFVLPVLRMTSCFYIVEGMGQNQRRHVFVQFSRWYQSDVRQHCFVQIARWRHEGRSLLSPPASCVIIAEYCDMSAKLVGLTTAFKRRWCRYVWYTCLTLREAKLTIAYECMFFTFL